MTEETNNPENANLPAGDWCTWIEEIPGWVPDDPNYACPNGLTPDCNSTPGGGTGGERAFCQCEDYPPEYNTMATELFMAVCECVRRSEDQGTGFVGEFRKYLSYVSRYVARNADRVAEEIPELRDRANRLHELWKKIGFDQRKPEPPSIDPPKP